MPKTMPVIATSDLRSEARSYQRDKNHNTKWASGFTTLPGQKCPHLGPFQYGCTECPQRPVRDLDSNKGAVKLKKNTQKKLNGKTTTLARKAFRNEVVDAMDWPVANVSDHSSSDEEVHDASSAPLPAEADFMYNYDTVSGPSAGNNLLSNAISQAVQRFENNETEKLVTKEYDVVDADKEYAADEDEDDFEMIDYSHLT